MPRIPSILEQELRALTPSALDDSFLARLTASAEGTATALSPEELDFEARLRASKPRSLPSHLESTLQTFIRDTPFAVDDKILLFHKSVAKRETTAPPGKRSNIVRLNFAAVAAVAAMGAAAALMLPGGAPRAGRTASFSPAPMEASSTASAIFAPASYNRNLSETHDEGVIWQGRNQPHRVLRLTYTDQVTLKNEQGKTVQVEQPRVEYVIIPEKID